MNGGAALEDKKEYQQMSEGRRRMKRTKEIEQRLFTQRIRIKEQVASHTFFSIINLLC